MAMTWKRGLAAGIAAAAVLATGTAALAWGADGHRMLTRVAITALPADLPSFLSAPQAVWELGELAREPDRSKGAGMPHDADLDTGHYVNVGDDGRIGGGPLLSELPKTRAECDAAVRAAGAEASHLGYLPYTIADGWLQLVKDFGYWRIDRLGAETATDPEQRVWFQRDMKLREALILRDLGYWSHFVGDAAQPHHVSIHFNAWGDYPNPNNYTAERIHGPFEGAFVHAHVTEADIVHGLPPARAIDGPILAETGRYIEASRQQVEPLFALWTKGGFAGDAPAAGKAFAAARLAAGAGELRDLIVAAWAASPSATVGYPAVKVADVESGAQPLPYAQMVGVD